ncbi:MAG: diphosphomevalonate decarboxylase [Candidatus Anstonellales archaeon]
MLSTYQTSPNIAIVKYWGMRDEEKKLPANGSISFTLGENLRTTTSVEFSPSLTSDILVLNKHRVEGRALAEVSRQLDIIRKIKNIKTRAKVVTQNNFPTGAGIASSASGFAALTLAACDALNLNLSLRDLSIIARQVSASASRSIYGGFVELKRGKKKDGSDSYSKQIASPDHWPNLRDLILIVSDTEKKVSSREGMQRTVKTNPDFPFRVERAEKRITRVRHAILKKDHETLFSLAMEESDDLHQTIENSKPPFKYLNRISHSIINEVIKINSRELLCAYTFDAGPNAHILTLEENLPKILPSLLRIKGIKRHILSWVGTGPRKIT